MPTHGQKRRPTAKTASPSTSAHAKDSPKPAKRTAVVISWDRLSRCKSVRPNGLEPSVCCWRCRNPSRTARIGAIQVSRLGEGARGGLCQSSRKDGARQSRGDGELGPDKLDRPLRAAAGEAAIRFTGSGRRASCRFNSAVQRRGPGTTGTSRGSPDRDRSAAPSPCCGGCRRSSACAAFRRVWRDRS